MNYIFIAISAYLLNAVSVTIDKLLITKTIPDPLVYIFYFSLISIIALFALPFVSLPEINVLVLASISTLLWTSGAYFMLKALKIGQVSRVIPIIGTIIPLILLVQAVVSFSITETQILGVIFLILGLILITILDWKGKFTSKELTFELLSAVFYATSYIVLRQAYLQSDFLTVLVYSRLILIPIGIALILLPATRSIIFVAKATESQIKIPYWKQFLSSKTALLFGIGQICAGMGELLLTFAISLANPALINSFQGVQYVFLFFLSLILGKKNPEVFGEDLKGGVLVTKLGGIFCIGIGLFILYLNRSNILY